MLNRTLATYLKIALQQRMRQNKEWRSQFGEASPVVKASDDEILELRTYISTVEKAPAELTPLEKAINENKK